MIAGLCALGSVLVTLFSAWRHIKAYYNPPDQRLIVRIHVLIPFFALTSFLGLTTPIAASILTPFEEVYEAFVIYTFFTLLTNLLGGERNVVLTTIGREPKDQLFPMNLFLAKVDISDPYTFLYVKRGILQYVWIKPLLSLATIMVSALDISGSLWIAIVYNISISISLYCLALFWYCLHDDLQPFQPWPKFLCIKSIIFFSYWQSMILALLSYFQVLPADNPSLPARIQNTLLCIELFIFSIFQLKAFPPPVPDITSMTSQARLPVHYALRDAFGLVDLVLDFKATFYGYSYNYREFNSIETVLEHPASRSRMARLANGMRYKDGGTAKYWLPEPGALTSTANNASLVNSQKLTETEFLNPYLDQSYGTGSSGGPSMAAVPPDSDLFDNLDNFAISEKEFETDEELYRIARTFPYGDYNSPVITDQEPLHYRPIMKSRSTRDSKTRSLLQQEYESFGYDISDSDEP